MKYLVPLLLLASLPAWAAPHTWKADVDRGRIGFTAYWNDTPVKGRFPVFTLEAVVDPKHPADGHIELHIDMREVTTQSTDITGAVRGKAWFDVARYPEAQFTSTSFSRSGDGQPELHGELRIKGHEKALSFAVAIERRNHHLNLSGGFRLNRTDFAIGSGQWSGGSVIAHHVDVRFNLTLIPAQ